MTIFGKFEHIDLKRYDILVKTKFTHKFYLKKNTFNLVSEAANSFYERDILNFDIKLVNKNSTTEYNF